MVLVGEGLDVFELGVRKKTRFVVVVSRNVWEAGAHSGALGARLAAREAPGGVQVNSTRS